MRNQLVLEIFLQTVFQPLKSITLVIRIVTALKLQFLLRQREVRIKRGTLEKVGFNFRNKIIKAVSRAVASLSSLAFFCILLNFVKVPARHFYGTLLLARLSRYPKPLTSACTAFSIVS